MNLEYFEDLFDASGRVWTEEEIKEVKVVAKMVKYKRGWSYNLVSVELING